MARDEVWFAQTVETYLHPLYSFIYRRSTGLDPGLSSPDDILADTWAIAWQKREQAPEDDELVPAWLYQIARHLIANHIRRTQTLRKHTAALLTRGPPAPWPPRCCARSAGRRSPGRTGRGTGSSRGT